MDRSRKANREGNEVTLQHKSQKQAVLIEELVEEKLAERQATLEQLKQTPEGMAELDAGPKPSASVRESTAKRPPSSTPSCVVGWTEKYPKPNRPSILRGKLSISQAMRKPSTGERMKYKHATL